MASVLVIEVSAASPRSKSSSSSNNEDIHDAQYSQHPSYVLTPLAPVAPCVLSDRAILVVSAGGRLLERRWGEDTGWGWVQHGSLPGAAEILRLKCASAHTVFALTADQVFSHSAELDFRVHISCLQVH